MVAHQDCNICDCHWHYLRHAVNVSDTLLARSFSPFFLYGGARSGEQVPIAL